MPFGSRDVKCSHLFIMQHDRSFLMSILRLWGQALPIIKDKRHDKNVLSSQIIALSYLHCRNTKTEAVAFRTTSNVSSSSATGPTTGGRQAGSCWTGSCGAPAVLPTCPGLLPDRFPAGGARLVATGLSMRALSPGPVCGLRSRNLRTQEKLWH